MGLAAGQARLLTITGRKSDCEFESMNLSHQKLALARELADISNEYQNSLDQTKLIYDYYGTGDTSTQLSYGILMSPSVLNDYMPTTITDSMGRVTLNSKYAAAARAAGIPQEGLGTLPSEDLRNTFIQNLAEAGIITTSTSKTIQSLPYNQEVGFGGGATVAITTDSGNIDDFLDFLNTEGATIDLTLDTNKENYGYQGYTNLFIGDNVQMRYGKNGIQEGSATSVNLGDMISGDSEVSYFTFSNRTGGEDNGPSTDQVASIQSLISNIIDQAEDYFSEYLNLGDGYTAKALEYARSQITSLYIGSGAGEDASSLGSWSDFSTWVSYKGNPKKVVDKSEDYVGWISSGVHEHNHNRGNGAISVTNLLNAYLTYFADFMNGVAKVDENGVQDFDVNLGLIDGSQLATKDKVFEYTWKVGSDVSSDDLGQATFYDALFTQICANGWTENDRIDENDYLQEMLQNGMLYISKVKDDGYYYQSNYATDTYIKEVTDDTKIAYAEAKYTTEKAKLNAKEETLDLKMKNLDTEISSLTTEYDTVKNTISKNIEKCFKRYNA